MKPANIILADDGQRAVLIDFGIAKAAQETGYTQTGQSLGTIEYMAPEQIERPAGTALDSRVDVYSLGVMAYQFLVGQLPFQGDSPAFNLSTSILTINHPHLAN